MEYVIQTLWLTTIAAAIVSLIWWGLVTLFRISHLPAGYTLTREKRKYRNDYEVDLWAPGKTKVGYFPESIYGTKGSVRHARAEAHKHRKRKRQEVKRDHQAWFDKRSGVKG